MPQLILQSGASAIQGANRPKTAFFGIPEPNAGLLRSSRRALAGVRHATRPTHPARSTSASAASPVSDAPSASFSEGDILDAIVVGAGISGLTTALALRTNHAAAVRSLLVTEARDRVGGNITSMANDEEGLLWEEGPNSFQPNDFMLKAAVDAGVVNELVFGDPQAPRFVMWEGRLRPTPSGPDVVTFDLMSPLGKIRAGLGAIGIKAPMPGE
jgi:protoporphyrinogen/coproporphyrinogen III oxidase